MEKFDLRANRFESPRPETRRFLAGRRLLLGVNPGVIKLALSYTARSRIYLDLVQPGTRGVARQNQWYLRCATEPERYPGHDSSAFAGPFRDAATDYVAEA